MSTQGQDEDREQRLDEAAAEFFQLQANGNQIDRTAWLAKYPELADDLAEFLSDFDQVQPLSPGSPLCDTDERGDDNLKTIDSPFSPGSWNAMPGTTLDSGRQSSRYRLRKFLARGGMGEVWLAEDAHVGREIAIKRIVNASTAATYAEQRFLFEAQVMGQLEHPCIVSLHDLGRNEAGELYCVMQLVKGCSLKEKLKSFHASKADLDWPKQVEFTRLLEAFVRICRAVAYAHSRSVLHRDIKPDNIMLGSYGEALLLDWGLAKALDHPSVSKERTVSTRDDEDVDHTTSSVGDHRGGSQIAAKTRRGVSTLRLTSASVMATRAGAVMGSLAYIPPELAAGHADNADQRTDVYLLGATLYEMLTGKPPREGSTRQEVVDIAKNADPAPPRSLDHRIPKPLEAICLRAMSRDVSMRYDSAESVAQEVENYLAGEPVDAYREPAVIRTMRWLRRHRKPILRGLAGVAITIFGSLLWLSVDRAEELETREIARQQLSQFRRLANEAQFFAASSDSVSEHAPYYDPQHAFQAGDEALSLVQPWGDDGSSLPLAEQRGDFTAELYELLLVLANQHQRTGQPAGASVAIALLDRASLLRPSSRAFDLIRARCQGQMPMDDLNNGGETDMSKADRTALDWFWEGEMARTGTPRSQQIGEAQATDSTNVQRAVNAYQQALRIDPQHYWAQFQLARCYLRERRGPEAIEALGTCIALRPQSPWAYSTRGLVRGLQGQFDLADEDLQTSLRLDPSFRPARLNRGFIYFLQRRDQEALVELDAVLAPPASSALIEAALYRAQIHYQLGDFIASRRDCEQFLASRPSFTAAHLLAAQNHFRLGDDSSGMKEIDASLTAAGGLPLDAQSDVAKIARGSALREIALNVDFNTQQRILALALSELQSASGDNAAAEVTIIRDLLGQNEQVVKDLTEQLAKNPDDIRTRNQRGINYANLKRFDLAASDFRASIEQAPEDSEAHAGLGYVRALQGDHSAAELEATQAVFLGANDFRALHYVACIYAELANSDKRQRLKYEDQALSLLERAIVLSRRRPIGVDEIELIRSEVAFRGSIRTRPEFKRLLGADNTTQ